VLYDNHPNDYVGIISKRHRLHMYVPESDLIQCP
jgi:hypothetical protein